MYTYDIITDSTSNLCKVLREKYNISYAPMNINLCGEEIVANLDWSLYSPTEFYNWMRDGKRILTTQVPAHIYEQHFIKSLENGKDILYICCSSGLSGSINIANVVADELMKKYPERKIICVDSLRATLTQGMIAIEASKLREKGLSIEENAKWIEEHKLNFNMVATVESLTYLSKAGRIKATSAFFGNLLGVKPMIIADAIGNNYAIKKVKGRRSSLLEIINMMKETIENPHEQTIYIEHSDSEMDCEFIKERIIKEFNPVDVFVNYTGPIIGSTVGPGAIIVSYYGKKVAVKSE